MRNAYRISVGEPKRKRKKALGRCMSMSEDNIKTNLNK
jgi:hypothetical protein